MRAGIISSQSTPVRENANVGGVQNVDKFTTEFRSWLPDNLHVYDEFEREALKVIARGFKHYSARTIIHVFRHHSALQEHRGKGWKLNDHHSPYLARLFDLLHPEHVGLWEMRETKAVGGFEREAA